MLDPEKLATIRRLFFAEHWKIGTIASELGVHRDTVRAAIETDPLDRPRRLRPSRLDPYVAFVRETLERHPRLQGDAASGDDPAARLRGLASSGCGASWHGCGRRAGGVPAAGTFPGEEAQVDWANFGQVKVGRAERALSCFVLTLTFSRGLFLDFFLDQTLENFLRGHVAPSRTSAGCRGCSSTTTSGRRCSSGTARPCASTPACSSSPRTTTSRPGPVRPGARQREGRRRADHPLRARLVLRRALVHHPRGPQPPGAWTGATRSRTSGAGPGTTARRSPRPSRGGAPRLLPLPAHPFETDLVRPRPLGARPSTSASTSTTTRSRPPRSGERSRLVASETTVRILDGASEIARHRRSYDRAPARRGSRPRSRRCSSEKQRARGSTPSRPAHRLPSPRPRPSSRPPSSAASPSRATTEKLLLPARRLRSRRSSAAAVAEALAARHTPRLGSVAYPARPAPPNGPATARLCPSTCPAAPTSRDLYVKPHHAETYDELSRRRDDDERRLTSRRSWPRSACSPSPSASTTSWPAPPRAASSPRQILEEIVRLEQIEGTRRSLESRLRRARIGRFKPIADFDWNWPKKIERDVIERALDPRLHPRRPQPRPHRQPTAWARP